ncbi:MAG: hypothetical protein HYY40_13895 [Bacteroidetes bacterium]|nr:hypothetical protein [Bacteroidota bacterium]
MKITKQNYFSEVKRIGFENLPEVLKKTHLVLMTKTDQGKNWKGFEEDKEFQKVVELAFEKLRDFIHLRSKTLSGVEDKVNQLSALANESQLEGDFIQEFERKHRLELNFIARCLKLKGKLTSRKKIKRFIDELQDAIRKKKIRRSSEYAREIMFIQKNLITIYNKMKTEDITIEMKKETEKRLKSILKRKMKKRIQKELLDPVSLKGISEGQNNSPPEIPENKLMSSVDFAEMKFETLGFSQKWRDLIGDPSKGFTAMVFGKPKTGKSYLSVDFAGYLARHHGDTLYVAKEEKLDATLHKKLQDKEVAHPNLFVSDFLPDDLSKYDFIFLDSVNKLGLSPKDIESLRAKNPGKSFIFIFQTTKQGQFRGRNEFMHDVDVVIEIPEQGKAIQYGRFNQGGELEIFESEPEKENEGNEAEQQDNVPVENL